MVYAYNSLNQAASPWYFSILSTSVRAPAFICQLKKQRRKENEKQCIMLLMGWHVRYHLLLRREIRLWNFSYVSFFSCLWFLDFQNKIFERIDIKFGVASVQKTVDTVFRDGLHTGLQTIPKPCRYPTPTVISRVAKRQRPLLIIRDVLLVFVVGDYGSANPDSL